MHCYNHVLQVSDLASGVVDGAAVQCMCCCACDDVQHVVVASLSQQSCQYQGDCEAQYTVPSCFRVCALQ